MQKREKTLLVILILVLLAWQGGMLVSRRMLAPLRQAQNRLAEIDRQLADKQQQQAAQQRARRRLAERLALSLPPEPLTAQRLYQQWLTDVAQHAGFSELQVFPDRVTNKDDRCVGVLVSIDAEATLEELCLFLHRFYRTALLHRITSLSIESRQNVGAPRLRVSVVAEGLALADAAPRKQLFPQTPLRRALDTGDNTLTVRDAGSFPRQGRFLVRVGGEYLEVTAVSGNTWQVARGADGSSPQAHAAGAVVELAPQQPPRPRRSPADYQQLLARNPFAVAAPQVAVRPDEEPDQPVRVDEAAFTYLVGAIRWGESQEAWFFDRLNDRNVVIHPGQAFSVAGIQGTVLAIEHDHVLLQTGNVKWRLRVGRNLRALERVDE